MRENKRECERDRKRERQGMRESEREREEAKLELKSPFKTLYYYGYVQARVGNNMHGFNANKPKVFAPRIPSLIVHVAVLNVNTLNSSSNSI